MENILFWENILLGKENFPNGKKMQKITQNNFLTLLRLLCKFG
jgi:hypothetical protein